MSKGIVSQLGQVVEISAGNASVTYRTLELDGMAGGSDGSLWSCWNSRGEKTDEWHQLVTTIIERRPGGARYRYISLRVAPGEKKTFLVHQLIARAFLGPCPEGKEVLHENDDGTDNHVENMKYGTHKQNMQDMVARGRQEVGSDRHNAKLNEESAEQLRWDYANEPNAAKWAERYRIEKSVVTDCVTGRTWKHVGGPITTDCHAKANKLRRKLTDEQEIEMAALYRTGDWSQAALGKKYGMSQAQAGQVLKRQGIVIERKPRTFASDETARQVREDYANGMTQEQVGQKHGLRQRHIGRIVRGESNPYAGGPIVKDSTFRSALKPKLELDEDAIVRRYLAGASPNQIANSLGCSRPVITRILDRDERVPKDRSDRLGQSNVKLTPELKAKIRDMHESGMKKIKIALELGLSRATVHKAIAETD